jgi:hypothetical protein
MYTGFTAFDSVKDSPEARTVVKSGAGGPSGGGFWASPVVPGGLSEGASAEGGGDGEGSVAGDVESVASGAAAALVVVSDVPDAQAAVSSANVRTRKSRFMGGTVAATICYPDDRESC